MARPRHHSRPWIESDRREQASVGTPKERKSDGSTEQQCDLAGATVQLGAALPRGTWERP